MQTLARPARLVTLLLTLLPVALPAIAIDARADDEGRPDPAGDMARVNLQTPPAELEKLIVDKHPAAYLLYAKELWSAGRGDEAVVWFYVGQLRYRFDLAAHPGGDPTGDSALYAALGQTLGAPINLYAGGDPDKWARQIDEALRWDFDHPNGFTSKTEYADALAKTRGGLAELRARVVGNVAKIKAEREREGIGTIGFVDGVYVEERNRKMPGDWPALVTPLPLEKLAGTYVDDLDPIRMMGGIFFFGAAGNNLVSEVELRVAGPDTLRVIGRFDGKEVLGRTISLRLTGDGAAFEEDRRSLAVDGTDKNTNILHQNAAGELVIERRDLTEGRKEAVPVRYVNTIWNRARGAR